MQVSDVIQDKLNDFREQAKIAQLVYKQAETYTEGQDALLELRQANSSIRVLETLLKLKPEQISTRVYRIACNNGKVKA